ncbi:hypothetical protein [Reyranella sp.]|nr:hypothetical protein [Reyranella sp.]
MKADPLLATGGLPWECRAWRDDRFAAIKSDDERAGREPSNLRYGFVVLG